MNFVEIKVATYLFTLQHRIVAEFCMEIHTKLFRSVMLEIGLVSFEISTLFST